ncbi:MAG TPA: glycosyltransferase family 39 protein [Rhodanobacteraceae bacterium]|nr:glycosyltransferase family 39 protein [Rhodanobacteraceae bacterium]
MTETILTPQRRWTWPIALILVTVLALGLRWYYVSTAMVIDPLRGDAAQYYAYAWNLFHHGVFAGNPPGSSVLTPSNYRDPGYPLFQALWMACLSNGSLWYAAMLMSQALLGALTVTCAMQLGRRWLDWRWTTAAGVLMAVWPHNITIAGDLLTETQFGFLCALAMLLCARACDRKSLPWAIVTGLCFGAAALTNAVLLPFGVLLALYLAWRHHVTRKVWVALLVGSLVLPGAWAIRNSQLPVQTSGHSSMGRAIQNLVQGSWPSYHAAYKAAIIEGDAQARHTLTAIDAETRLLQSHPRQGIAAITHRLGQHPWRSLAWYTLEKPYVLWGWRIGIGQNDIYVYPTTHSPFQTQPVMRAMISLCQAINPLLAVLMLACLVMTLLRLGSWDTRSEGRAMLEASLALLVFVTLVYCVLQSDSRYSIPFRAFEMLLATTACSALVGWLRKHVHASRQKALPINH